MAELCGIEKTKIAYTVKKGILPPGTKDGARLEWSLSEARRWIRDFKADGLRDPALAAGVVVTVANFKGGVSKTTTAAALAQGLSLRGHRVPRHRNSLSQQFVPQQNQPVGRTRHEHVLRFSLA